MDIAGEQGTKQLTIEEELPRHVSFSISAGIGQVEPRLRILYCLLVQTVAGELDYAGYVDGAEILIADQAFATCKDLFQPWHGDVVSIWKVVLALNG